MRRTPDEFDAADWQSGNKITGVVRKEVASGLAAWNDIALATVCFGPKLMSA